jgi:calcineurin-like phosphoesterase family protein
MAVFFWGCTHFDHANIIKLADRPFSSVEEMNETMIENHNKIVGLRDVVYHLGDFGFCKQQRVDEIARRLNGTMIKVKGNHDEHLWSEDHILDLVWHKDFGQEVLGDFTKARNLVLCHYPIEDWNGRYHGAIHIHAHTHKTRMISAPNRFNVCVEAIGYRPISLETIMALCVLPGAHGQQGECL